MNRIKKKKRTEIARKNIIIQVKESLSLSIMEPKSRHVNSTVCAHVAITTYCEMKMAVENGGKGFIAVLTAH